MFGLILAATVGGPFPLLMTPYSGNGELDCETLAREAAFVADCGVNGIIWPSAGDALNYLSDEEERRGLEAIADALDGRDVCFTPCCPGTNTADAVRRLGVAEQIAAKPVVKTVFTGWGGRDLLYHFRRIGTRGVITQRPSYADLIVKCYKALEAGTPEADELFMKILLLRNLDDALPEKDMRGWHMHALMRRGVFRNALSRTVCSNGVWQVSRTDLSAPQVAEMEYRMRACGLDEPPKEAAR